MERKNLFRKLNFLIALAAFFVAAIFYGCDNLLSSAEIGAKESAASSQPREGYGTISGVLPTAQSSNARTAMPSVVPNSVSYKVFAMNDSSKIFANVKPDGTFLIELPFDKWCVTVNALDSYGKTIATQKQEFTISEANPNISLKFTLGYSTNSADGAGEISLLVSFPNTVKSAEWILEKDSTKFWKKADIEEDPSSGTKSFKIDETLADLGAYNLTINFYGEHSILVYRIDQIVNVYANLLTDKFVGSAEYISSDGKIVLEDGHLKKFQNTTLYVGGTDINGAPANDTNTGTQFDPLATLNRALELVRNSTLDASTEFRVFLKGDVGDGTTLSLDETKTKTLTIASADSTAHTITGIGNKFTIPDNTKLVANNVNFKDIGFTVEGTVDMDNCTVDGGDSAGGIHVEGNASLTMNGGEITDCHSSADGGGLNVQINGTANLTGVKITACDAARGGAVYTNGTLTMTNCDISENETNGNDGGGGVYVYRNGTFTMNGGEISGNTTDGDGAGVHVADGGTFTMNGAAKITEDNDVYISSGVVKIGELSLSENVVAKITIPQDLYKNGTKIIHKDGGTITDDICDKFKVTPDASGVEYKLIPDGEYGVLKSMSDLIYVRGSGAGWYEDNGKGGIIGNDTYSGNLENPFKTIKKAIDTVLARNDGSEDYTIYVDGEVTLSEGDLSGAEEMASFVALDKTLKLTIKALSDTKKATLNANNLKRVINATPDPANGGVLNLKLEKLVIKNGQHNTGRGGGIHFNFKNGSLEMSDCEIIDNKAKRGGGISVFGGTLTATNCKISNNSADNASDSGGGVYIGGTGKLELKNVEISGNTASGSGGGVYVGTGATFDMTDGNVINNTAASGGGISVANTAVFTLLGGTISGNMGTNSGGGIYFGNGSGVTGKVTVSGGEISDNTTEGNGGGIYSAGTLELVGAARIEKNTAIGSNSSGGGIYIDNGGIFEMTLGTIGGTAADSANSASLRGGGVCIQSGGMMRMSGGAISNNTARYGAGIYAYRTSYSASDITLTMNGGTISKNLSTDKGGGIFVLTCAITMNNGEIKENKCQSDGGGVFVSDGTLVMAGGTISDNYAKDGGGVCISRSISPANGGKVTIKGGAINGNTGTNSGSGIAIKNYGVCEMEGGLVSGNTSNNKGKGAYLDCNATLVIKGAAQFAESNDIYLYIQNSSIPTIQVDGALAATSVATITPSAYAADTRILSAGTGVTIDQTICDKFSVTPQSDGTKWKIMPNSADNTGVLKKGDLSGGIEIVIPGLETYTFKVIVDDGGEKDIVEGMTLHSGKSVTLKEVTDSKGRTPSGTCTLQIRDSSGNPFPGAQATGTPTFSVSVPVIPPVGDMPAQVYVELTLDDGTVINKTVNVTISN